ncbi:unnamed protein product [Closterium sp. NIES-53]
MASLRVLSFDPEGRPVAFDTWHNDLQLYLLSNLKDSVSLFDHISGAAPSPPATADVSTRSQWLSRDATARLAIHNHLPSTECAHFGEHRTAQTLYDAVVARYSSPAIAAIGRLLLPYLFPELSAFATVADPVTHLRTSDARYRAAVPTEFLPTNQPPMFITLYFIEFRLPESLRSIREHFLTLDPTSLTVDLLEQHLFAAETSAVAVGAACGTLRSPFFEGCSPSSLSSSFASAAAAYVSVPEDIGAASTSAKRRNSKGKGGQGKEVEAVKVVAPVGLVAAVEPLVAAVEAAEGVAAVEAVGPVVASLDPSMEALVVVGASNSSVGARPRRPSSSGDCYRYVPPDPGIAAAALGASAFRTPPGTALAEALHTFTLDSGASRCFFRDSTTLTPLSAPVPVRLADPSGGPLVARSSTVLPCPAVPSSSLSGLHLPSFSTNLVSTAALQDEMVTTTTPGGQRVSICTCTRTRPLLATSGSRLLLVSPPVAPNSSLAPPPGSPLLPRFRGMHSRLLVSRLPRSLPPLPPSPAPPCLPCVEGRQRAAPHSSSFPSTTAPLQTLHMDVWGLARVSGQGHERYFLLVVDDYTRYTTVFPLRSKGEVSAVLIPWIRTVRLQLRERFGQDLPVQRLHFDRGGDFSSDLLQDFCRGEGITHSFTLPNSPQQNGIAERRIGLVMEVARTSMIHAVAPHFLWPFAVRYAAHQLNLWPRVSLLEISPTLRWTGNFGDASVFRFYHPTSRRVLPSQDVMFDESVPFFHDSTTLIPLPAPVSVRLADPSGGSVVARSSTVLPCPAVPSGSLSGLHLPSFSMNLVSTAALQDAMVTTTTSWDQRVSIYTCTRTGRHLATFTRQPGLSQVAASCSCRLLLHQTLLWHHCLGYPSLPCLRGMHSRLLVSGLPKSLPPLPPSPAPPCLPCVEGRQRAAPHSSSFPPTTAPLQTLHMDVWGPAHVSGQGRKGYFMLVVDDYTRYTTVFPLHSKDLPVLRLHSDRGGEFSSNLLRDRCRGEGILQSFTLLDSPQQNGIAERRIGLVMEVARTSMIHAAAPHFLWLFAVQYAAYQLNLWPRVSLPETSLTLRWTGEVGDASVFWVWGSRAFVGDMSADKLSARAIPCEVTFDESVPFYRLFPYHSAPPPPLPLFLAPGPPPVDPLPPQGPAHTGVSQVDPLLGTVLVQVAIVSGAAPGAASGGAASRGAVSGVAEPGGAGSEGAGSGGAQPGGAEPGGAESEGVESRGAKPRGAALFGGPAGASPRLSSQQLREGLVRRPHSWSGAPGAGGAGDTGAGGPAVPTGAVATGGVRCAGAGDPTEPGAAGTVRAGAGVTGVVGPGVGDTSAAGVGDGGTSAGGAGAAGAGAVNPGAEGAGDTVWPRPYFVPLLQQVLGVPSTGLPPPFLCPPPDKSKPPLQSASPLPATSPYTEQSIGLTERREPASRPVSHVLPAHRVPRSRPPPVPGTHTMALCPSSVPLRVPLPAPPESSLPEVPDPESDLMHAASPTIARLLATAVTDPYFDSSAASALVAQLLDFAAACRLDYATALVAESVSTSPPSVGGECALGTEVIEDRQEDFECLGAAVPRFASMLLAPEGDPDAPDIPTPRSYAEAITGFSHRQGVDYLQTFSPTPKMTTLRVLLHVAAQRDYELHSLHFSKAFLQGSLHEEIWLRRPPGFTRTFPAGTQWSLRRPVYGLRQAPREWHDALRTTLAALRFAPSTADPSQFLRTNTSLPPFYVLVYVNDLVFATADTEALTLVKLELQKRHTCTDLGELRSYLGLQITRDRARRTITLTQSHMVHQVLQRFGFQYSSSKLTPLSTSHLLSAPPLDESIEPSGPYPELGGSLMYLMTCTQPDLAYPLSLLAHYVAPGRHQKLHWDAAKRVLRYLCSTSSMGRVLGGRGPVVFTGHADASWVDDSATQRLSQGYTFSLGSGSVSWQSTRSSWVLSSSCEAEICAGAMAAQELRWLTYLLTDLGEQPRSPLVLYQRGQLRLSYVATRANTADVFTKALPPGDHQRFVTVLGLDLVSHLRTSDARYRATVPAEFLERNQPLIFITLYFIVTRLPNFIRSVTDHFLSLNPTSLSIDLLEQHLHVVETSAVAVGAAHGTPHPPFFEGCSPSPLTPPMALLLLQTSMLLRTSGLLLLVRSVAAARAREAGVVEVAAVVVEVAAGVVVGVAVEVVEAVEVVAAVGLVAGVGALVEAVEAAVGVVAVEEAGLDLGVDALVVASGSSRSVGARPSRPSSSVSGCFSVGRLGVAIAARMSFARVSVLVSHAGSFTPSSDASPASTTPGVLDDVERSHWADLLRSGVAIFDIDYDAILSAMYALSASAEGDCYQCVPPDPGKAATGTAPTEAFHTFTLDSSTSRFFFRDAPPSLLSLHLSQSGSHLLLVSPPLAPDSSVAPPPGTPLPATPSLHALPSSCLWSTQVSASPLALACPALPSLRRGTAAHRSSLLLVSLHNCSRADSPHGRDLPVLCLHSDRGGDFSSNLLEDFCHWEGILQAFTLSDSPQQNGVAERRIGLVIEVARTSPTLSWTGEVGDASVFRVWGHVRASPRMSPQQLHEWLVRRACLWSGATGAGDFGDAGAGGAGVTTGAAGTGGTAVAGLGGARSRGVGVAGTGVLGALELETLRSLELLELEELKLEALAREALELRELELLTLELGVLAALCGSDRTLFPCFSRFLVSPSPLPTPSLYTEQSGGLTERREPASCPVSPVRTTRRVSRSCPPPDLGTHIKALCPSSVPLRVPLPAPPESSLPGVIDPESDRARAASPTVSRPLATTVTDPSFESAAASALVAELLDFAAACHIDYATALVAESSSASPPSVGGECALGTDVLEDRQEDFEYIPTPCSYAEAITGPYSSQWQAAMDAEMASWKSTGTYIDEVPPPGANIVDGMWIFRVKRPPGSAPAFKARYVAQGFSQRQGVDYFQAFSPTPKMTTLLVLLHVAAQRDYELHSHPEVEAHVTKGLALELVLKLQHHLLHKVRGG